MGWQPTLLESLGSSNGQHDNEDHEMSDTVRNTPPSKEMNNLESKFHTANYQMSSHVTIDSLLHIPVKGGLSSLIGNTKKMVSSTAHENRKGRAGSLPMSILGKQKRMDVHRKSKIREMESKNTIFNEEEKESRTVKVKGRQSIDTNTQSDERSGGVMMNSCTFTPIALKLKEPRVTGNGRFNVKWNISTGVSDNIGVQPFVEFRVYGMPMPLIFYSCGIRKLLISSRKLIVSLESRSPNNCSFREHPTDDVCMDNLQIPRAGTLTVFGGTSEITRLGEVLREFYHGRRDLARDSRDQKERCNDYMNIPDTRNSNNILGFIVPEGVDSTKCENSMMELTPLKKFAGRKRSIDSIGSGNDHIEQELKRQNVERMKGVEKDVESVDHVSLNINSHKRGSIIPPVNNKFLSISRLPVGSLAPFLSTSDIRSLLLTNRGIYVEILSNIPYISHSRKNPHIMLDPALNALYCSVVIKDPSVHPSHICDVILRRFIHLPRSLRTVPENMEGQNNSISSIGINQYLMPPLREIVITNHPDFGPKQLKQLTQFPPSVLKNVSLICLRGCKRVTSPALSKFLLCCPLLEYLDVSDIPALDDFEVKIGLDLNNEIPEKHGTKIFTRYPNHNYRHIQPGVLIVGNMSNKPWTCKLKPSFIENISRGKLSTLVLRNCDLVVFEEGGLLFLTRQRDHLIHLDISIAKVKMLARVPNDGIERYDISANEHVVSSNSINHIVTVPEKGTNISYRVDLSPLWFIDGLIFLSLAGWSRIGDLRSLINRLVYWNQLKILDLSDTSLTDDDFRCRKDTTLTVFPALRLMKLSRAKVTNITIRYLLSSCPLLEVLDISGASKITETLFTCTRVDYNGPDNISVGVTNMIPPTREDAHSSTVLNIGGGMPLIPLSIQTTNQNPSLSVKIMSGLLFRCLGIEGTDLLMFLVEIEEGIRKMGGSSDAVSSKEVTIIDYNEGARDSKFRRNFRGDYVTKRRY